MSLTQPRLVTFLFASTVLAACSAAPADPASSDTSDSLTSVVRFVGYGGKCLDATGGRSDNGTKVQSGAATAPPGSAGS